MPTRLRQDVWPSRTQEVLNKRGQSDHRPTIGAKDNMDTWVKRRDPKVGVNHGTRFGRISLKLGILWNAIGASVKPEDGARNFRIS